MKKKIKKRIKIVIILILLILISLGVGYIALSDKTTNDKKQNEEKKEEIKPIKKVKIIDVDSKSRPYAVMINNNKAVWGYQAGIQDSHITYEIIVEGGITRLMAIFKDKETTRIASIRSSRHYFLDYALENDAIYAHIGQSPQALKAMSTLKINKINADNSSAFTWDNNLRKISREHRAYTSIGKLSEAADKLGYRKNTVTKNLLEYSVDSLNLSELEGALPANSVKINYSNFHTTSFVYDAENKVYKRFQNNLEHKDYITGLQYTAKNIITYQVYNYTMADKENKGRQDLNNIGTGEGYYISEGYYIPITWEKTSSSSQTIYKIKSTGKQLVVNDGNTYIEIQPKGRSIVIE